jgi:hypothetical protein
MHDAPSVMGPPMGRLVTGYDSMVLDYHVASARFRPLLVETVSLPQ